MIEFIDMILAKFRVVFSRKATFEWFVLIVFGLMIRSDGIGVTTLVRELGIQPHHYESMIHFFRSNAWSMPQLINCWVTIVNTHAPLLKVEGYNILIGDGIKQAKEGKKMPAVKKHHQESENSSKAKYIMGHMFGVVSVLIGNAGKQFSLPLSASIQDGDQMIRQYADPALHIPSHAVRVVAQAGDIAKQLGTSVLLLDRYFLGVPALKKVLEYVDVAGIPFLQVVMKAKISCKAYTEIPAYCGRGRPRKKGYDVKLQDLFQAKDILFETADLYIYGKIQTVEYYCTELLWGKGLYQKLRFVLIKSDAFKPAILVSTSFLLSPTQIIELYSYRFKIEVCFKALKHTVFGLNYHFWSKHMPKLNRYHKQKNMEALKDITCQHTKEKIASALKAIEGFVMCSCIAIGILQMVSIKFSATTTFYEFRWLRTITNLVASEATVSYSLKKNLFQLFLKYSHLPIIQIIISKQEDKFANNSTKPA